MKRLILTTQITLHDDDAHFLKKYMQGNGFKEDVIASVENSGSYKDSSEEAGITVDTTLRLYDLDQATD